MSQQLENIFIGIGDGCLEHWRPYPCDVCQGNIQRLGAELRRTWEAMHMSWSASVSSVEAGEADAKLKENFDQTYPTPTVEVSEQFAAALSVVRAAILSVQPDLEGLVTVSASGHANPGHRKAEGWSNDTFTLTVYQV